MLAVLVLADTSRDDSARLRATNAQINNRNAHSAKRKCITVNPFKAAYSETAFPCSIRSNASRELGEQAFRPTLTTAVELLLPGTCFVCK